MGQRITVVDSFTEQAFTGNPAAVCVLSEGVPETWMQKVAAEMNLSEACFLLREGERFSLRWFTPTMEVDLCGHATLAAAHVLWEQGFLPIDAAAEFNTRSGLLVVVRRGELMEMDFPAKGSSPTEMPDGLQAALNTDVVHVERNARDLIVEVAEESAVGKLEPDLGWVASQPGLGMIVTSRSNDAAYDFVSRYFAPKAGIDEDPVCGSAHCCLAPYWGKRLSKTELIGHQISARGGVVIVALENDRVRLSGKAITVLNGELSEAASPTPADKGSEAVPAAG